MKTITTIVFTFFLFTSLQAQNLYFPPLTGNNWDTISPTNLGWCTSEIDTLYDYLEQEDTKAFILLKDGKIVLEKYFNGFEVDSNWVWFSAGKSLMSTMIGIAQSEGDLNINNKASDYLGTGWTNMPQNKEDLIKVRHQLSMSTGLDETVSFSCTDDTCLQYLTDAGSRWFYHNAPYSLLKETLQNATNLNINTYTTLKIKLKIGMNGFWLPIGDNNFFFSTPRSMARFGLLTLNRGEWNGNSVLSDTTYYNQTTTPSQSLNPAYGYLWWLNGQSSYILPNSTVSVSGSIAPDAPSDLILAAGAQGQFCAVVPSQNLVMIRMGGSNGQNLVPTDFHNDIWKQLNQIICTSTSTTQSLTAPITLFPNPATNQINLKMGNSEPFTTHIYNATGQLIQANQNTFSFDISNYPNGFYFLKIVQKGKIQTAKFLKL
ncbi:MAG: serine hydrolase [Saprospiraceae bacterium]